MVRKFQTRNTSLCNKLFFIQFIVKKYFTILYFIKVSFCKLDLRMDENDLFKLLSFGFGGDLMPVIEFSLKISLRN